MILVLIQILIEAYEQASLVIDGKQYNELFRGEPIYIKGISAYLNRVKFICRVGDTIASVIRQVIKKYARH